ncbi:MAG: hypothetical protein Q8P32_03570 [Candidatus Komeilibacteria bacterium]|nr:hypothetical protein [Candidatus Komeilibacteria bacterium]
MTNYNAAPPDEQMKKMLEQNLAYSKQIYLMTKKVKNYMMLGIIMSWVKIFLVVAMLVLGVIYLPPLLQGFIGNIFPGVFNQRQENTQAKGVEELLQNGDLKQEDLIKLIQQNGGAINSYKNILDLYNSQ